MDHKYIDDLGILKGKSLVIIISLAVAMPVETK